MSAARNEITESLIAWSDGTGLHRLARHYVGRENRPSIQATEPVNEAYLRLVDCQGVQWQNRAHFLALSARMMRRILADFRTRAAATSEAAMDSVPLDQAAALTLEPPPDLVALNEAIDRFG